MPAIGEGRRSSSLDPAGSSLSRATRGSVAGCSTAGGGCTAGGCTADGWTAAARTLGAAAQTSRNKRATIARMLKTPKTYLMRPPASTEVQPILADQRPRPLRSAARMMLGVQVLEAFAGDVCVDLGGR